MEIQYKRSRSASYMILHEDQAQPGVRYQTHIFLENGIPGFLPCHICSINGDEYFYYDITGFQSVHNLFENRKFDYKELEEIFGAWVRAVETMEEYLLESDHLLLGPQFIYRNQDSCAYGFIWFPFRISSLQEELRKLTEYLLPKIDHKDKKAVSMGYGIYKGSMEADLSLERLKQRIYLEDIQEAEAPKGSQMGTGDRRAGIDEQQETYGFRYGWEKGLEQEDMCQDKVREKILDDFYKDDEDEEGKPYGFLVALVVVSGIAAVLFLTEHYRLLPLQWILALLCMVLVLAGVAGAFWVLIWKPKKAGRGPFSMDRDLISYQHQGQSLTPGKDQDAMQRRQEENGNPRKERNKAKEEKRKDVVDVFGAKAFYGDDQEKIVGPRKVSSWQGEALTQVLSQEKKTGSCLVGVGLNSGQVFSLEKDIILIGKWRGSVDIWLDVPTVSRIHGKILHQEEQDLLVDLNSKNGTVLNGEYLDPEKSYPLQDGDRIAFAQEEFLYSASVR